MWNAPMRLNEVFPDAISGSGIFHYLNNLDVPWKDEVESGDLDLLYHLERSDDKYVSPIVTRLMGYPSFTEDEVRQKLANVVFTKFHIQWEKLYATLSLEYDPISNYDMIEKEEIKDQGESHTTDSQARIDNLKHTRVVDGTDTESGTVSSDGSSSNTKTLDLSHSKTGKDSDKSSSTEGVTSSDTGTVVVDGTSTTDSNDNRFGFNSTVAVPADTSSSKGSNKSTTTNDLHGKRDTTAQGSVDHEFGSTMKDSGTDKDSGTSHSDETRDLSFGHKLSDELSDTGTVDNKGKSDGTTSHNQDRTLTRKGNIGVTTSQQMLQSERALWIWSFFSQVFQDIDQVITLPIY